MFGFLCHIRDFEFRLSILDVNAAHGHCNLFFLDYIHGLGFRQSGWLYYPVHVGDCSGILHFDWAG